MRILEIQQRGGIGVSFFAQQIADAEFSRSRVFRIIIFITFIFICATIFADWYICGLPAHLRSSAHRTRQQLVQEDFCKVGCLQNVVQNMSCTINKMISLFFIYLFIFLKEQSVYALAQLCDYSVISADNLRQSSCEMNKRYPGMIIEWSVLNVPRSQKFSAHSFDVFMFFIIFF